MLRTYGLSGRFIRKEVIVKQRTISINHQNPQLSLPAVKNDPHGSKVPMWNVSHKI